MVLVSAILYGQNQLIHEGAETEMRTFLLFLLVVMTVIPAIALAQDPEPRGVILISSRNAGLLAVPNSEGPAVGDVAMAALLGNAGYRTKVVADTLLTDEIGLLVGPPTAEMVVLSGSSGSANVLAVPDNIPVMMGEHVTLQNSDRVGYIPFYTKNDFSDDANVWPDDASKTVYIKIVNTTHPITQGIQTDANGLVQILRDPYPTEDSYSKPPTGSWYKNYEFGWPQEPIANKASGLTVLAVSPMNEAMAVFAVFDVGDTMADGTTATARYVHMFINEQGSNGTRRRFNSLNETGRLLFVRAAQWAMGDPLSDWGATEVENWDLY